MLETTSIIYLASEGHPDWRKKAKDKNAGKKNKSSKEERIKGDLQYRNKTVL